MEYVDNAYKLQIFTLRRTAHFPKRYQRRIGNDIEESASLIHACAVRAEENKDIFDEEQFSIRRTNLRKAFNECAVLVARIKVADDVFGIPYNYVEEWMEYIDKEQKVLIGVIRSDNRRRSRVTG